MYNIKHLISIKLWLKIKRKGKKISKQFQCIPHITYIHRKIKESSFVFQYRFLYFSHSSSLFI